MRAVSAGLLLAIATFVVLIARAIALYPGGTWFDPNAVGHDALRNFLCDLTQPIAINGVPNPGAPSAKAAMIALDVGLLLAWMSIPSLVEPSRLTRWLRLAGVVSFLGIIAVPLTPSLEHGILHAVAVISGAFPGIAAGIVAMVLLARSPHRALYRIGVAMLIVAAIDALLYLHHVALAGPPIVATPAIQRVALSLLLTWMVGIAITLFSRQR